MPRSCVHLGIVVVTVVGAGLAGLVAAQRLRAARVDVVVREASDRPGGRLSTVDVGSGGGRADMGAQFFTVRSPEFRAVVDGWLARGWVYEWCRGFTDPPDGYPRYAATGGMATLAGHLAAGLDIEYRAAVERLPDSPVIATPPIPVLAGLTDQRLPAIEYDPCLAVAAALDRPPTIPPPGGVQLADGPFTFVADNAAKGVSSVPMVTLHAEPELSERLWAQPDAIDRLLAEARPWLGGAQVVAAELIRWPHAKPRRTVDEPCIVAAPGVILAGDFCAGAKVEGASRAGLAAADALLEHLG